MFLIIQNIASKNNKTVKIENMQELGEDVSLPSNKRGLNREYVVTKVSLSQRLVVTDTWNNIHALPCHSTLKYLYINMGKFLLFLILSFVDIIRILYVPVNTFSVMSGRVSLC